MTFYGGREHTTTNFPLSIRNWKVLQNSIPREISREIACIERGQIDANNVKRTEILLLFFGDVFTTVVVVVA